ncbi:MAG TPA: tyrosine protein phosphatase [bacterium]|nr:tyrosine protein phosphatase [bacterium]
MIDIHSHILPFIDDGADDWDCALTMLAKAEAEGIRTIVATPHILSEHNFKNEGSKILQIYDELRTRAKQAGLKIEIIIGSEIYAQPDTSLAHQIATINSNQKYFLIEFPLNSIPRFVPDLLFKFAVDGIVPIIAHPERNAGFLNRYDFVYEYVQRGNLMQINEGSLRGRFGNKPKELAFKMIEHKLAHFVASDGHKKDTRTVTLAESYALVTEKSNKKTAQLLFYENPRRAILGEPIDIGEILPMESELKKSVWQKLKTFSKNQ